MATPSHRLPLFVDPPASTPQLSLDDSFLPILVRLAVTPIRPATQKGPGLLREEGLGADVIRALAIRWCKAEPQRTRFDAGDLEGLAMALHHYDDSELRELIEGAILVYGAPGV